MQPKSETLTDRTCKSDLQVGVLPGWAAEVEPAPALLRLEAVHHRQHPGIGQ